MNNPTNIHECCGIITVSLCDPLSLLISKIMGLKEDDPNAVGFYYQSNIYGTNEYTVTLFNVYDNDPIPWLRLGSTMDLLLSSPFITRITFYPLLTNKSESEGTLLSRATMLRKRQDHMEEKFRVTVIEAISNNAKGLHDKHVSYTNLLLKLAGIEDVLTHKPVTGYTLINHVLLSLMKIPNEEISSSSIVPCPLLKAPISIRASYDKVNDDELRFVVEESRREITKLVAIFVDLYTSHELFRTNILTLRTTGKLSSNLDNLINIETELVSHVIGGLQTGILSNSTLNDIIKDLSKERISLGINQSLPVSLHPNKHVEVTNTTISCTFQQEDQPINTNPLRDLGIYLAHLVESFQTADKFTIDLNQIILSYNNTIQGTNLPMVVIPDTGTIASREVTAILCDYQNLNEESQAIPMSNGNLTNLSEGQLNDLLVYIDSLRDSDGITNMRFANLQNQVTYELARRKIS